MKSLVGIGVLAFFSCLLFGGGAFLHSAKAPAQSASTAAPVKAAHGKAKAAKPAAADLAPAAGGENSMAFPLMLAGGAGLFVSALAALGVCRSLSAPTPEAARRMREAERAAQRKQQEDSEATQAALQAQLAEARQRKTETEALRDQVSRQFQEFFRTLPVPCFCFAASGKIIRWNAACEALYGIPAAAALESTLWDTIVPSGERDDAEAKIRRVLAGESLLSAERTDTVAGGGQARLRCSLVPLRDAEGVIIGGLSAGVDVTEFAAAQAQIAALTAALEAATQAATPPAPAEEIVRTPGAAPAESSPELSGHPAFRARLAEEIERAARYHAPLSLVLLDLDGFSARNRACGFEAGDAALDAAGAAIKSKIRTVDVLARLGADEYALILPETGEAGARVAADRLRAGIGGISLPGQPPLSACVGAALLSPEISGAAMLITRALDALNAARASGPGSVTHFQDLPQIVSARPGSDSPVPARPRRAAAKTPKI